MLELIREKLQGAFATVIVVFLCAVFALWGVETLFQRGSNRQQAVVTVDGEEISQRELASTIETMRRRYAQMLGGKVDPSFLSDKMLREPALESLIGRKLLQSQAACLDMAVGSATVDKAIVSDPNFSRDGKTFDPEYYKEVLRNNNLSAAAYQASLREQLVSEHLQKGIAGTAFVTPKEVADIARLAGQTRTFSYVLLPLKDAMVGINPSDESVQQYYQQSQNDFLTEEKVTIEYLELSKEKLLAEVTVDEADVRASYDKEAAEFKPVKERHAAHILVEAKDETAAQAELSVIQEKLNAGESFEKLAKQYSRDEGSANQGGDVGFSGGDVFVPEFETALAALQNVGDISPPVKTEFGYHIIKLLEQRETRMPSFEERREQLEKQLRQARVGALYSEQLDKLSETTYSAGDLAGPAQELGLTLQKSAPFGHRGGAGIAAQQKVIDAAFSAELLDSGKNSQVIELSADKAVVLRVASHDLPSVRALDEVKPGIVEKLKAEEAGKQLQDLGLKLESQLAAGALLDSLSGSEKIGKPQRVVDKERNAVGIDPDVLKAAFALARPQAGLLPAKAVKLSNGDWALVQLAEVKDPVTETGSPQFQSVQQRMDGAAGETEFSVYEQSLRDKAKITRKAAAPADAGDSTQ